MKADLEVFLRKITKTVDSKIKKILELYVDKNFRELVNYQIETGGKRLRPVLVVLSCLACGGKMKDALDLAARLEILHNWTLIVDDIIDHSELRRKKETVWRKFGKSIAECVGIDYGASVFQGIENKEISQILAKTIKKIVEGEILDILFEAKGREEENYIFKNRYKLVSERDYLEMVSKKTASLFEACCKIGVTLAKAKKEETLALAKYGFNLGISFQIRDDILDIFGSEKKFGKEIGKDIKERKLGNIVILKALEELPEKEREKFLRILRKGKINKKDVKLAIKLIEKTRAKEKAEKLAKFYGRKSKESLRILPKNRWVNFLSGLTDFIIEREK